MKLIPKPQEGEFAPYAIMYVDQVPDDGQVLAYLETNFEVMRTYVLGLPQDRLDQPHAPGEWTVKDILMHVIDNERIFAYRILRLGRGDETPLAGYDQTAYVPNANANARTLEDILDEYKSVRDATMTLLKSLDATAIMREGNVSGFPVTVRGMIYIIAGHELHHLESIKRNYG